MSITFWEKWRCLVASCRISETKTSCRNAVHLTKSQKTKIGRRKESQMKFLKEWEYYDHAGFLITHVLRPLSWIGFLAETRDGDKRSEKTYAELSTRCRSARFRRCNCCRRWSGPYTETRSQFDLPDHNLRQTPRRPH